MQFHFIIVGQGIAGTMLSWFLLQQGKRVLVFDNYDAHSSSNIAGGVIKPVTGRRFVKTWLADELLPFAEKTYKGFEVLFNDSFYHPATFIKLFDSVKEQNDWSVRCATEEYKAYLKNENIIWIDNDKVKNTFGGFEINGSRVECDKFLAHYRHYLRSNNALLDEVLSPTDLKSGPGGVTYKNHSAPKIIFCEGAAAIQNPYFKFFPFQLAKGEWLIIEIENFCPGKLINGEVLVIPLPQPNRYYVGATHEWYFDDAAPTEKGKNELEGNLQAFLNVPYKIIYQKGAIRPTVKDRRPFIGFHPQFHHIGIFNGMGTKGFSLAPYFAAHFAQNLVHGTPIIPEVDIQRFLA